MYSLKWCSLSNYNCCVSLDIATIIALTEYCYTCRLTEAVLCPTGIIHPKHETSRPKVNPESGDSVVTNTTFSMEAIVVDCTPADNAVVCGMATPAQQTDIIDKSQQQVAAEVCHMELRNIMTSSTSAQLPPPTGNIVKQYKQYVYFDYIFMRKGKGSFYIAQYPVRWSAQSTLHFLPSLTDLFIPTPLGFSGKHSSQAAITRQDYITHISTTVHSQVLIYTDE